MIDKLIEDLKLYILNFTNLKDIIILSRSNLKLLNYIKSEYQLILNKVIKNYNIEIYINNDINILTFKKNNYGCTILKNFFSYKNSRYIQDIIDK